MLAAPRRPLQRPLAPGRRLPVLMAVRLSAIRGTMLSRRAASALFVGLTAAVALGGAARAEALGACIWSKLSPAEHATVLAAYRKDMGAGAAALEKLGGKLKAKAALCAHRGDISPDWIQTITGSEAVQTYAADALMAATHLDRPQLDAAWTAAPAPVAACVRANGRLAFFSNGLGCVDPTASAWLLKRLGLAPGQQPAARQALYYFNAKAIGEWGDTLGRQATALVPLPVGSSSPGGRRIEKRGLGPTLRPCQNSTRGFMIRLWVEGAADGHQRLDLDGGFVAPGLLGLHLCLQAALGADRAAHRGDDVVDDPRARVAGPRAASRRAVSPRKNVIVDVAVAHVAESGDTAVGRRRRAWRRPPRAGSRRLRLTGTEMFVLPGLRPRASGPATGSHGSPTSALAWAVCLGHHRVGDRPVFEARGARNCFH